MENGRTSHSRDECLLGRLVVCMLAHGIRKQYAQRSRRDGGLCNPNLFTRLSHMSPLAAASNGLFVHQTLLEK